ncbi:transcriptional regulator [Phaeobacter gallaeciensis]|uniref:Transcriptional regulator n=2 Tax=Roseobacteraceae TaxID=2854170 RepID=A0A366X2S7_9RHOB|nr:MULTISPECIES: winged helix DNA-binding protein [Roseobacteraceae]MBT3141384.1 winged helix DNA-binding protein [Falsiruegeria litorea]MBT8167474.1 winged helix DNA-binding protein [Falsiruegeria litorea]RBW57601.1 transcriptional regulator [Phaeobacter gallaeciensis]
MSNVPLGPIVSSAHLADGKIPELSEFEFGLIIASHAFERWTVRAMAAAGYPELSSLDVLVLHTVHHRGRPKKLADICLVLNVEDTHTVNYAIKKLAKAGLVTAGRLGKEKTVEATDKGAQACETYREIRETLLLENMKEVGIDPDQLGRISGLLRLMSGQYDQAARAATAY